MLFWRNTRCKIIEILARYRSLPICGTLVCWRSPSWWTCESTSTLKGERSPCVCVCVCVYICTCAVRGRWRARLVKDGLGPNFSLTFRFLSADSSARMHTWHEDCCRWYYSAGGSVLGAGKECRCISGAESLEISPGRCEFKILKAFLPNFNRGTAHPCRATLVLPVTGREDQGTCKCARNKVSCICLGCFFFLRAFRGKWCWNCFYPRWSNLLLVGGILLITVLNLIAFHCNGVKEIKFRVKKAWLFLHSTTRATELMTYRRIIVSKRCWTQSVSEDFPKDAFHLRVLKYMITI